MERKELQIKERIVEYLDLKGVSQRSFYRSSGVTNGVLGKPGGLSEENLAKTLSAYPELNPSWLIMGTGPMFIDQQEDANTTAPSISGNHGVPYYDVDFQGGFDLLMEDQTNQPAFYIDFPPFNDADCWVNVSGKSMSPFISHGDIVALKKMEQWPDFLLFGEIYAVITREYRTIKILGEGKDNKHFTLIPYSKSEEFSKQPIPKKLITHIFQVKGSIKKFF